MGVGPLPLHRLRSPHEDLIPPIALNCTLLELIKCSVRTSCNDIISNQQCINQDEADAHHPSL